LTSSGSGFFSAGPGGRILPVSEPVGLAIKTPCYSKCFFLNSFPAEPTLRQAQGPVFSAGPGPGNSVSEPVELPIIFCQVAGNSVSEPVELAIKTPCYSKCFFLNSFPNEPTLRQAQGPVFFPQGPGNSVSEPVELAIIFCQGPVFFAGAGERNLMSANIGLNLK
jgi:hypothetical protein